MCLRLGDAAPDFTAKTTTGTINFYDYLGTGWGILFSHPADFTPVCTTELGRTAKLAGEFARRNTRVLALSVDPVAQHLEWIKDINDTQEVAVDFPIIDDSERIVAGLYDMIHPNVSATQTVRSLFIIDPDRKIRLIITYPAATGRNFAEVLRVLDSLQLTSQYGVATPADWWSGEDVIVLPSVPTEVAKERFSGGVNIIRPWLRYVADPSLDQQT